MPATYHCRVPTICAMGVCGQFNHSSKEYALVETLYTRAKLLTCAVLTWKSLYSAEQEE